MSTDTDTTFRHVDTRMQAHLLNQVQDASATIRRECASLVRVAAATVEALDEGMSVNSRGVLQSTGRDLDEACQMRYAMASAATYAACAPSDIELAAKGLGTFFTSVER